MVGSLAGSAVAVLCVACPPVGITLGVVGAIVITYQFVHNMSASGGDIGAAADDTFLKPLENPFGFGFAFGATCTAPFAAATKGVPGALMPKGTPSAEPTNAMDIAAKLQNAAIDEGPTVTLYTKLTQFPQAGRALSTSVDDSALANAARVDGKLYKAVIPKLLYDTLLNNKFADLYNTSFLNGGTGKEFKILPQATQFVVHFFTEVL